MRHGALRFSLLLAVWLSSTPVSASPLPSNVPFSSSLEELASLAPRLSEKVLGKALRASRCAISQGLTKGAQYLGVIDYTLPSTEKRFWMFDVKNQDLLLEELVAHGKNTGENYARYFSNELGSLQSSLGLFRTGVTYTGKNGFSLRLHGLEKGVNDLAFKRTIVMHGAPYVSEDFIHEHGRLGRSWGCPALRPEVTDQALKLFEKNGLLFIYSTDAKWETDSPLRPLCH